MSTDVQISNVYTNVDTIVDRRFVERGVLEHLQTWTVPYLAAIERHYSMKKRSIPQPKSWRVEQRFNKKPQDMMPFVAVVSTGFAGGRTPRREADGTVTAWWAVAIGAVVAAATDEDAKAVSGYYGAAIRLLMTQVPDLGGWANFTDLNDERYDDWAPILEQMVSSVRLVFTVEVQGAMNFTEGFHDAWGKPEPPEDPYADPVPFPDITEKEIDVEMMDNGGD